MLYERWPDADPDFEYEDPDQHWPDEADIIPIGTAMHELIEEMRLGMRGVVSVARAMGKSAVSADLADEESRREVHAIDLSADLLSPGKEAEIDAKAIGYLTKPGYIVYRGVRYDEGYKRPRFKP